ncbi:MAG: 6,7-dimethyl-8-ribityllumazine synthase [Spirochaetales bacterium]|nr:6,7-dimethyl-8-ribityllumazine synthase [Spirochaetales bacterium]
MNEINILEGQLTGVNKKFAIVLSRFNSIFTERLLEGAVDCLKRHGVKDSDITVARVPGAFEIPIICQKLAKTGRFDGIIALGAVIRGDTPHFDYVAAEVSKGIAAVSLSSETPIAFGVLTTDTIEQAEARSGSKGGNKGFDAAMTVLEMVSLADIIEKL